LALLLGLDLLAARCGPIPFAETFATPAIASLDEAEGQVVRAAVAAHELLCLRLTPSLLQWRSRRLGVYRFSLLSVYQFRAFHFLGLLQPYRLASDVCSVASTKRAIEGDGKANVGANI
jgi:hypothetical protein